MLKAPYVGFLFRCYSNPFTEYLGLVEARIEAAREAGTLDVGVETILAERMVELESHLLRTDPHSGAETRLVHLELHRRRSALGHATLMRDWGDVPDALPMRNARSGRIAMRVPTWPDMDEEDRLLTAWRMLRPADSERISGKDLHKSHWQPCDAATFEALWTEEVTGIRATIDVQTIHLATGLLLPVWNRLPDDSIRVWRVADETGQSLLGRMVPPRDVATLGEALGVSIPVSLSIDDMLAGARSTDGIMVPALDNARLVRSLVNGQQRIEMKDFDAAKLALYKSRGAFSEVIAYKTRLFIPVDRAAEILAILIGSP